MKSIAAAVVSSSIVSIRFFVSGPVSSILPSAVARMTPARTETLSEFRVLRIVGVFRLFLGVQVIEVAEELVEAVFGGQEFVLVAEMVLAKLPGIIAERLEKFGNARILRAECRCRRRAGRPSSTRFGSATAL